MLYLVIFTFVLLGLSVGSVRYLWNYRAIVRHGSPVTGICMAIHPSGHLMKRSGIPKIEFTTNEGQQVVGSPVHSWFTELNFYLPGKSFIIFHDPANAFQFVVKSFPELLFNMLIVTAALISVVLFLLRIF